MIQFPPIPSWDALHPLIMHFPIGLLLIAPVFILLGSLLAPEKGRAYLIGALILMALGTGSIFIAVQTGEAAGKLAERTPAINAVLEHHEQLGAENGPAAMGRFRNCQLCLIRCGTHKLAAGSTDRDVPPYSGYTPTAVSRPMLTFAMQSWRSQKRSAYLSSAACQLAERGSRRFSSHANLSLRPVQAHRRRRTDLQVSRLRIYEARANISSWSIIRSGWPWRMWSSNSWL